MSAYYGASKPCLRKANGNMVALLQTMERADHVAGTTEGNKYPKFLRSY
ncbi:MAG: hypothetical protein SRB1_02517 [Desulfobacteraceae bacterium Eth-SRB1]|nr:MAG: hypothetical protein SRB1_02517 [Desulfobacteraceae bacterium Eth-SRB1]